MQPNAQQVVVGTAAPDITLRNEDGDEARLSAFWQRQPTVFVFIRHFG